MSFCYFFCLVKYNACYNVVTFVIQVRWDETSNTPRPERVSPWKIEPALAPPALNPLSMPRPKRPRSNAVPSSPDSSVLTREGIIIWLFIFDVYKKPVLNLRKKKWLKPDMFLVINSII